MIWDGQDPCALLWLLDFGWSPWRAYEHVDGVVYLPEGWT